MKESVRPENAQLLVRLLTSLEAEEKRAAEKQADRDYWLNVGDIEMLAAQDIRSTLGQVDSGLATATYTAALERALEQLAQRWRGNDFDEDGYGVATVHAVGRLLPDYRR